jgi:predicted ribosomally synthesized peptide with SipW-like signal peptide
MDRDSITVTRRRLLAGAAAVGVASAGAGAGTMALLSDNGASTGNSVSAGTLDLTLEGSDATVEFLTATDVAPGETGQSSLTLANAGSLTGYVDVEVASLTDYENGLAGNENSADGTGGDPGAGNGELSDYLEVHAEFRNGPELWSGFDAAANRLQPGTVYDEDYQLDGGTSDDFVFEWQLPSGTGDDAQSDSVAFALTFSLDQEPDPGA